MQGLWQIVSFEYNLITNKINQIHIKRLVPFADSVNSLRLPISYIRLLLTLDVDFFEASPNTDLILHIPQKTLISLKVFINPNHSFMPNELDALLNDYYIQNFPYVFVCAKSEKMKKIMEICDKHDINYEEKYEKYIDTI